MRWIVSLCLVISQVSIAGVNGNYRKVNGYRLKISGTWPDYTAEFFDTRGFELKSFSLRDRFGSYITNEAECGSFKFYEQGGDQLLVYWTQEAILNDADECQYMQKLRGVYSFEYWR